MVFEYSGTLDKFIGDALMATWGGIRPASQEENARNAVLAALKMRERLAAINVRRKELGIDPWSAGIGISLGPAIFGNIGSQQRMDLTVIGDTVNLASRIEALTRVYGCDILVDESIAKEAGDVCHFLEVDVVRVKGRKKPERLFFPHRAEHAGWAEAFAAARTQLSRRRFRRRARWPSKRLLRMDSLRDWRLSTGLDAQRLFPNRHEKDGKGSGILLRSDFPGLKWLRFSHMLCPR